MTVQRILVVDDDPLSRQFLTEAVQSLGYTALAAQGGEEALERVAEAHPDLVLTDLRMPGVDGLTLTRELHQRWEELPIVVITAHGSVQTAVEAMQGGAADFLLKPTSPEALRVVIERVARTRKMQAENEVLRAEVCGSAGPPMIAESNGMIEVLRSAARISRSKGTVLITGESGTGKERVAQYIHQASQRADQPFIRVNCAALSEQLLESELFGHERGAFTGAHKQRQGRFELADEGTLLLDELGEISPKMQAKLLRVLQEDEFERVGGTQTLKVDVRVIAATNKNLADEVAAGRFREDLYYRLHVLPLHVPPLRERPEDVLPLTRHFCQVYAKRNGMPTPGLAMETAERMQGYSWPGNVRELENVVQRGVVLSAGPELVPEDLLFGPATGQGAALSGHALCLEDHEVAHAIANNPLADIERVAFLTTLECAGGNKTEAARRLGVTARTISNKLKIWRATGLVG
jgi:two-component system response regulator AtoC